MGRDSPELARPPTQGVEREEERMRLLIVIIQLAESTAIVIIPVYLYGWKVGILVASGLSSLFNIACSLDRIADRP